MNSIIKNKTAKRLLVGLTGFLLWLIIAIPVTLRYMDFGKESYYKTGNLQLVESNDPNQIKIDLRIQYRDLAKRIIRYYIAFKPTGNLYNNNTNQWQKTVEFNMIHEVLRFEKGSSVKPIAFDAPLITGNLRDYPFDRYISDIEFKAIDADTRDLISVTVYAFVYSQNTKIEFNKINKENGYNVEVQRTSIVYAFCAINLLVNWALAILVIKIAYESVFNGIDIPPPIISIGILLLFALPSIRLAQPDIPGIGCAIDFLGFIWCEILVSVANCGVIYKWILKWKSDKSNSY